MIAKFEFPQETFKQFLQRHDIGDRDGLMLHRRISTAFAAGEFRVKSVERFWFHDIWAVKLFPSPLRQERKLKSRINEILRSAGVPCMCDDIEISIDSKTIHVAFGWARGREGVFRPKTTHQSS